MPEARERVVERPLHGEWVHGLKIDQSTGRRELSHRWYAMEFAIRDRVRTSLDEHNAGIGIVELFDASGPDYEVLSLEEAISRSLEPTGEQYIPMRFLVSLAASGMAVATSRMGYDVPGDVRVLPPSRYSSYSEERPVHLRDYPGAVGDELLTQRHVERMTRRGIDPSIPIAQTAIDDTFRYMLSGCHERR